jgi:hypothetical protein
MRPRVRADLIAARLDHALVPQRRERGPDDTALDAMDRAGIVG